MCLISLTPDDIVMEMQSLLFDYVLVSFSLSSPS